MYCYRETLHFPFTNYTIQKSPFLIIPSSRNSLPLHHHGTVCPSIITEQSAPPSSRNSLPLHHHGTDHHGTVCPSIITEQIPPPSSRNRLPLRTIIMSSQPEPSQLVQIFNPPLISTLGTPDTQHMAACVMGLPTEWFIYCAILMTVIM